MSSYRELSLWHDTLPPGDTLTPRPALSGDTDADVAIVGAGYTGLWTALYLLRLDPSLRVLVIERDIAGFGASGRNGGWASAILPMSFESLQSRYGADAATRMQHAMEDTIDEIGVAATEAGIDCHFAKGGTLEVARNDPQEQRVRRHVATMNAHGIGDLRWLDAGAASSRIAMTRTRGAAWDPHCAAIHPARLVRGLAEAVERLGARIVEQTAVRTIDPGRLVTDRGVVRADIVVRATEGFTPALARHRRTVVPVYSLMIATEPLPDEVWNTIGLVHRETFHDARRLVIYGQRTADGRLAFGGRGAPYHYASAVRPEFDRVPAVHDMLRDTLVDAFPVLADARVTHRWGGPLGLARDWHAGVGLDRASGMAWAGGYVGDGVATANLAGRTLADLITGRDTDLVSLPWVGHRSRRWEPEPIRWLAIRSALRLPAGIDRVEEATGRTPRLRGRLLDLLTKG